MSNRLVIFDCDGTLVDGQHAIVDVMTRTFDGAGLSIPSRDDVRSIIGLSLPNAMRALAPDLGEDDYHDLSRAFENSFGAYRAEPGHDFEPLYPGVKDMLRALDQAGYVMAVATGKSLRGLKKVLAAHEIGDYFVSLQTADHHPSKPHPSMVSTCIADGGSAASHAVVIGDTHFDMDMASNAGVFALGVDWGYHDSDQLVNAGAKQVLAHSSEIPQAVAQLIG